MKVKILFPLLVSMLFMTFVDASADKRIQPKSNTLLWEIDEDDDWKINCFDNAHESLQWFSKMMFSDEYLSGEWRLEMYYDELGIVHYRWIFVGAHA